MDLELDDEQRALAESVRTVLAREWPASALRTLVESGADAGADELWSTVVSLDWPALVVPEDADGMGYGPVESTILHEGCGAAVVPGPLLPTTALYLPMLRRLGSDQQQIELLAGVASGSVTGTAALAEPARSASLTDIDPADLPVVATPHDDGWLLRGTVRSVIEGAAVDDIVVPARVEAGDGVAAFIVARPAVDVTVVRSLDETRQLATVELRDVVVGHDDVLGEPGSPSTSLGVRRAVDEAVTALAAELVGTCTTIFATTVEYVKDREQFGVKIGSFQAIKHRLADAYVALEAARAAVRFAGVAVAEDDPRCTVAASSAKALAGDCAHLLATEGIQMLGGIGFTWEHDMQLYVKRATASSALLGTAEQHRQRVAARIGLVAS